MAIYIGMDIGGTSVKIGAWQDGKRLAWSTGHQVPDTDNEQQIADKLAEYIQGIYPGLPGPVDAVGVGACGLLAGGVIFQSPNTPWDRLALVELLTHRLALPVHLANDADAFLLAGLDALVEKRCVALGITLGTGIGTALWIRDQLFAGGAGVSPEGGHITLGIDRAPANTGIPGSWEFAAGSRALMHYYGEAGGNIAGNPEDVAVEARRGESAAIAAWVRYGRYVGAGLGSLCNVLSPDYVLIGGGMVRASDLFERSLRTGIERHLLKAMPRPELRFFSTEEDTVAKGGALHAAHQETHGRN